MLIGALQILPMTTVRAPSKHAVHAVVEVTLLLAMTGLRGLMQLVVTVLRIVIDFASRLDGAKMITLKAPLPLAVYVVEVTAL